MAFPQNDYPNFTNFPFPSFPQEIEPPDSDTDAGDMICVTYSRSWTAVLMSACSQLIQLSSWKGTDDEKKLAASRAVNLQWQLQHDIGCDMGCCYDVVLHRITPDGNMEISINGGDWIPDPNDPRTTATQYPPIVFDENHTKCDAASNVNEHLNDLISGVSEQLGGAGSLLEIAAAIAAIIFALFIAPETIPALVPLILPLVSGLLFLGQAAWDAYFDSDTHDKILCAIFCSIGEDGTFTAGQYAAMLTALGTSLTAGVAKDYFIDLVGRIGLVGINDYAAVGTSADADCTDCDCGCGDLHFHIAAGTLVSQTVNEDGNCVLVIDSAFTGAHDDLQIYWNSSGSCDGSLGLASVIDPPTVVSGDSDFAAYRYRAADCVLIVSFTGSECGAGMLWESNGTGGGHGFRLSMVVRAETSCP